MCMCIRSYYNNLTILNKNKLYYNAKCLSEAFIKNFIIKNLKIYSNKGKL